jgi:hypothetical protein
MLTDALIDWVVILTVIADSGQISMPSTAKW